MKNMLHGIIGSFEAILFDDVKINNSLLTEIHTENLYSWGQFIFPLEVPMFVDAEDNLTASIQRLSDAIGVWYEWSVYNSTKKIGDVVQNVGGIHQKFYL